MPASSSLLLHETTLSTLPHTDRMFPCHYAYRYTHLSVSLSLCLYILISQCPCYYVSTYLSLNVLVIIPIYTYFSLSLSLCLYIPISHSPCDNNNNNLKKDNFCIALLSDVHKLTALYNILQHFLS